MVGGDVQGRNKAGDGSGVEKWDGERVYEVGWCVEGYNNEMSKE